MQETIIEAGATYLRGSIYKIPDSIGKELINNGQAKAVSPLETVELTVARARETAVIRNRRAW